MNFVLRKVKRLKGILVFSLLLSLLCSPITGYAKDLCKNDTTVFKLPPNPMTGIEWEKKYDNSTPEDVYCVKEVFDGYVVCGYNYPSEFFKENMYLFKVNKKGDIIWERTFGGDDNDQAGALDVVDDGYVVAGWTKSFGNGESDVCIFKTSPNGQFIWTKYIGGEADDQAWEITKANDFGTVAIGYTESKGAGGKDIYVIKLDDDGNILWEKTYGTQGNEVGTNIKACGDGYILTAITDSTNKGHDDAYILKIDELGHIIWENTFGGAGDDRAWCADKMPGGFIITGCTNSIGNGDFDIYVLTLDANGNLLTEKAYGKSGDDRAYEVRTDNKNNQYFLAGYTNSMGSGNKDMYLVKLSSDGTLLKDKTIGTCENEIAWSTEQTKDGGYIISGQSGNKISLVKLASPLIIENK